MKISSLPTTKHLNVHDTTNFGYKLVELSSVCLPTVIHLMPFQPFSPYHVVLGVAP